MSKVLLELLGYLPFSLSAYSEFLISNPSPFFQFSFNIYSVCWLWAPAWQPQQQKFQHKALSYSLPPWHSESLLAF